MWYFTEEELDTMTTFGQQYEIRKVKMLRLCVSCKMIERDTNEAGNDAASLGQSQLEQTLTGGTYLTSSEYGSFLPASPTLDFTVESQPEPVSSNMETWNAEYILVEDFVDERGDEVL